MAMDIKISKTLTKNRLSVILLLFCCVYMAAITFIGGLKYIDSILFLLFQIFIIFLPGYAIYLATGLLEEGKERKKSNIVKLGLTYLYGWISNLFLYILIVTTGIIYKIPDIIIWLLVTSVSCLVIIYILKRKGITISETDETSPRDYDNSQGKHGEIICIVYFVIYLIVEFITYTGNNFIPVRTERSSMFGDVCYWIGNTIELTKGFPPHDFRHYPQPYNYHYLSSMQMALVTLLTEIRPVIAGIFYNSVQVAYLLIFGLYSLFSRLTKGNNRIVVSLMALFLFSCGFENITYSTNTWHMYIVPFGFDYGLAFLIWGLYFALDFYEYDKIRAPLLIKYALMIVVISGVKGPAGLILLAVFGIVCIEKIFKKDLRRGIGAGAVLILAFAVVYWKILNVTGYQRSSKGIIDYVLSYANNEQYNNLPGILGRTYSMINGITNPFLRVLGKSFLVFPFMALCNPAAFLLGCVSVIIASKVKKNNLLTLLYLLLLYGLNWVALCVPVTGLSNRYFSMYAVYLGIFFCAYELQLYEKKKNLYLSLYLIAAMGCVLFLFAGYKNALIQPIYRGVETMKGSVETIPYAYRSEDDYIRHSQLYGLEIIRNMDDGLIVTNMDPILLGVFSEKHIIIGTDFDKLLADYRNDEVKSGTYIENMIDRQIRYIVIDKYLDPQLLLDEKCLEMIYSDNDFDVYEIAGSV